MRISGYFINLKESTARSEHMRRESSRLDLQLSREAAVDGMKLSPKDVEPFQCSINGLHKLSQQEVGCFLSHRNVWRRIANGKNNFGAVFEDDLTFSNDARYLISDDGWIPEDVDIIKIETTSRKVLLLPPFSDVIPGRQLGKLASVHMGGGGYILSKNIAARLLSSTQKFGAPVDYVLFSPNHMILQDVSRLQMFPAICVQQVRSKNIFLPKDAELSKLDGARAILKIKGWQKFWRELMRPYNILISEFSHRLAALKSGGRWLYIKYRL